MDLCVACLGNWSVDRKLYYLLLLLMNLARIQSQKRWLVGQKKLFLDVSFGSMNYPVVAICHQKISFRNNQWIKGIV